jgi:hypothetical protein
MMQIFATRQKTTIPSNSIDNNEKTNNLLQTNQAKDYQILIGENSFTPCTSQQNLCQRDLNDNNSGDNNRNYISSPNIFYLILFLIIYILLILLGASVFSLFEQKAEFQIRDQLLRKQQTFLAKHHCVDGKYYRNYNNYINYNSINS